MTNVHLEPANVATKLALLTVFFLACNTIAVAQQTDDALAAARSLLQQHKTAEAISQLKELAAMSPYLRGVNHELGVAYYREGDYLQAAEFLQNAWAENPNDRDAVQLLGLSLYSSGRPGQAIPALEKVRTWHPNENVDAVYILGLCYVMTTRYAEALQTFARLYGVKSDSAAAHLLLGRMMLRQGFDPAAENEIHAALLISPQLPLAHLTLGEINVYGGNYPKAIQEFQAELDLNPGCAPALTHLGEMYWRQKRDNESQKALRQSIWLDATVSEPYVVLGKVLLREGQAELAEKNLVLAINLDSGNYTAHYILAQLYREQGKAEAAEREMKVAARIQQRLETNAGRN